MRPFPRRCAILLALILLCGATSSVRAQLPGALVQRKLVLPRKTAIDTNRLDRLIPSEEEQEQGNAVPVLLRMVYEKDHFVREYQPKLTEYYELDVSDPRIQEIPFDSFARLILRAGSMSFAEWEYPLDSDQPYLILLPDMNAQRWYVGRGMTIWIKQQLSKGETAAALDGVRGQLGCSRHIASTPILVCNLVAIAISNLALDNLELVIAQPDAPNMYWSLAMLPPTLNDLGAAVRWELAASPLRLKEPLPEIGSDKWKEIAEKFFKVFPLFREEPYTPEEAERLKNKLDSITAKELVSEYQFTQEQVDKMSLEERIMRWLYILECKTSRRMEAAALKPLPQFIAFQRELEQWSENLLKETGAKSDPFYTVYPPVILTCHAFARRVKFLQTIESLRDYASKHDGAFPSALSELELPVPNDPFTDEPFLYEGKGDHARLRQAEIPGVKVVTYDYELSLK